MAVSASSPSLFSVDKSRSNLRTLDAIEEFLWLVEQRVSRVCVLLGEIEGETTIDEWRIALRKVQPRFPLLSASIGKVRGERPYFASLREPMELRVVPLDEIVSFDEEMTKEVQKGFGDASGLLMRITLFHGKERSALLLAAHHTAFDGISNLLVMRDLLRAMAGEELGPVYALQPGVGQLCGLPAPSPYTETSGQDMEKERNQDASKEIRIRRVWMGSEETSALVARARREGTGVHGALVVSLLMAGRRSSETWRTETIQCSTPVDLRKMLGLEDAAGLILTLHRTVLEAGSEASFWEMARAVKEDMRSSLTMDGARAGLDRLSSLVAKELSAEEVFTQAYGGALAHQLVVTNYGNYTIPAVYGKLKLKALSSGSAAGGPKTQKISVMTFNGRLGMTLVSPQPFPHLLEDAREILIENTR